MTKRSQSDLLAFKTLFVRGASGVIVLKFSSIMLSLALSVVLARPLGAEQYGIYAYAISITSLLAVPASLGFPQLVMRSVAIYRANADWKLLRGLLLRANQTVLGVSLFIAIVAFIGTWLNVGRFNLLSLYTFWIALLILPLNALNSLQTSTLQGLHCPAIGNLPRMLVRPLVLIVMIVSCTYLLVGTSLNAVLAMGCNLVSAGIAFSVGAFFTVRKLPTEVKSSVAETNAYIWIKNSLPFLLLNGITTISEHLNIIMLGIFGTSQEVGTYRVAATAANLISIFLFAANTVIAPYIAQLYSLKELDRLQHIVKCSARVTSLLTLPIALAFIFLGKWFLSIIYGQEFEIGATSLSILTLGQLVNVAAGSVGLVLNMSGYERDVARVMGLGIILNIILNFALIPHFGMEGVAISTAVTLIAVNIIQIVLVRSKCNIDSTVFGRL